MSTDSVVMSRIIRPAAVAAAVLAILASYLTIVAPFARASGSPTIASDQADYPPGATVTLTGADWTPGLGVHIRVDDSVGSTWSLDSSPDPVADPSGALSYQFTLSPTLIASYTVTATQAQSDGSTLTATTTFTDASNYSITLDAANPFSYNHATGGGAWNSGKVGVTPPPNGDDVVSSLEGGEFKCGDHVTFLTKISANNTIVGPHTLQLTYTFTLDTTGQQGLALGPVSVAQMNYGTVQNGKGPGNTDAAISDNGNSVATLVSQTAPTVTSPPYFTAHATNTAVINVTNVEAGETTVLRVDAMVQCLFGSHPTGNLQAALSSAFDITNHPPTAEGAGNQTVDFKAAESVIFPGEIIVKKTTQPSGQTQPFNFTLTSPGSVYNPNASPPTVGSTPYNKAFSLTDGTQFDTGFIDPSQAQISSTTWTVAGPYTLTEGAEPTGWGLVGLVCTSNQNGTVVNSTTLTTDLTLHENEVITCTYTNKLLAKDLTIDKTVNPTFNRKFTWGITKDVDKTKVTSSDGSSTFTYTVNVTHDSGTNSAYKVTGAITVTNPSTGTSATGVSVSDQILDSTNAVDPAASCSVTGGSTTIAAGGSATFNYTCTYTGAPATTSETNKATVTWTANGSPNTSADVTKPIDWSTVSPAITDGSVSVSDTFGGSLGTVSYTDPSPKTFTYSHTFTGDPAGTCTTHNNTATFTTNTTGTTGSASQSVQVCVGKDLTVTKTATPAFGRTFTWGITKSVDKTQQDVPSGTGATFKYTVSVTHDGGTDSGWTVSGTIAVSNPNNWEPITASLADAVDNGSATCAVTPTSVTIPASGTKTASYTCTYSAAPTSQTGTNTATATWDKTAASTPDGSATGTASIDFSAVTPAITDGSVTVTDTLGGTLGTATYLDPSPKTFTYSKTFTDPGGTCTTHDNTATFTTDDTLTTGSASKTVTVCVGLDLTVSKTATPAFGRTYTWGITKDVDKTQLNVAKGSGATFNYTVTVTHDNGTDSGWTVSGTITVTNPNDWESITANVGDAVNNGGSCTVTPSSLTVLASKSSTANYTCTYASAPNPMVGTNTATATWDKTAAATPTGSASGSAAADFTSVSPTITDGSVTVTDTLGGTLGTVSFADPSPTTFTYSHTFTGDPGGTCTTHDNTATFTTDDTKTTGSASKTVTVCVGEDLTVSKTASGSFTRTYTWGITKDVDQTEIDTASGTGATFNYTVNVTHDVGTDSGWQVAGTITVTNPNDFEAITANLSDAIDNGGSCTVTPTSVTVPKSGTATASYTCTYASAPTKSSGLNTATASWNKDDAATPTGSASGTATADLSTPTTIVDGSVDVTDPLFGAPLGTVSYTDASPTTFTYSHTFTGDPVGTCTSHDNTATFTTDDTKTTGSASKTVTVCVGVDLTVSKTATSTFTRTYTWGISKSVDKTEIDTADGTSATFNYTVNVTHDNGTDSAWQANGTITVTNPNDFEAVTANLADTVNNGGTCKVTPSSVSVPASGQATASYTCTYGSAPSPATGTNTATATWDKAGAHTPTGSASGTASVDFTTPTTIVDGTVSVSDPLFGGILGSASYTDPSPKTFTYSHTFSGDPAGTCTSHDNTATFTTNDLGKTGSASQSVKVCVGSDLIVSKNANPTATRTITWGITKDVDKTSVNVAGNGTYTFTYTVTVTHSSTDSGWKVTGNISITNPNDWEAISGNASDAIDNMASGGGSCVITGGSSFTVPASQTVVLPYVCTYTAAPTSFGGTNTGTAAWDSGTYHTPDGTASGTASVAFFDGSVGNPTYVDPTVDVTDSVGGALGKVSYTDPSPTTFTYQKAYGSPPGTCSTYDNTATFTSETSSTTGSASKSVAVCSGADLTVSKTATPAMARQYNWSISKNVDHSTFKAESGSVTPNYTVIVSETGFTDSGWTATGTITVSNPNTWEGITGTVTDAVDNGGTCSVTTGTLTVPASGTASTGYTCTWASAPSSASGTNTATVTWDGTAASTPDSSASGTAGFTFNAAAITSTKYKTITVTDTFNGGAPQTLGTLTATDTMPFTTHTYTYSRTIPVPAFGCKVYPNTAKIVETGQQASATVTVCGPAKTGALTMGFWQNKNGQGIITGQAKTGICPSGTWLRQYAPFQDLSATATCAQVATYVTNVIKSATAGGSTMNPMLKAQMLATALDVYFSDPALGGNKIGAFNGLGNNQQPIGGVTIDLTKVCIMFDSGTTGTCNGATENASAAFGGATSLTVSQILAYAASQSNVGGTVWYGQVKATQGLAKDTFDAINNQKAFVI
jgi:hypothetical protein